MNSCWPKYIYSHTFSDLSIMPLKRSKEDSNPLSGGTWNRILSPQLEGKNAGGVHGRGKRYTRV